jgi:hypothetical protein
MSDEFEITIPVVRGEGVGVPIGEIQRAINSICQQIQTDLNEIASGGFPLTDVDITGGTIAGVAITGGTINSTPIGATTPGTAAFTTLAASGTVSGNGFTAYLASPPVIGGTAANAATFTTLTSSGPINVAYSGAAINLNDTSGAQKTQVVFKNNGTTAWDISNSSSNGNFALDRWVSGSYVDSPITVSDSTGLVSFPDGINPSQTVGVVGTTTNNNANVGSVGEYVTATALATSVSNGTAANAASISLTAGDWDVSGILRTNPAGTTAIVQQIEGISTTSATLGVFGTFTNDTYSPATGSGETHPTPVVRISIATTTTVFLIATVVFSVSTCTVDGMIRARRVR